MIITLTAILEVVTTIAKILTVANLAVEGLKMIGKAIIVLGKALEVIMGEPKAEELGDKSIQAEEAGIKPEQFKSYEDYMKEVSKFELDPEKSKKISTEEKLERAIRDISGLIAEKYPQFPIEQLIKYQVSNPEYFTPERMNGFADLIKANSVDAKSVLGYLDGTERNGTRLGAAQNALVTIEKKVDPSISDAAALQNVIKARE
jgi:hypothetical protein